MASYVHAARFDPTSLTVNGDRSLVDEQVLTAVGSGVAEYSVARNGTLVYVSGTSTLKTVRVASSRRTEAAWRMAG